MLKSKKKAVKNNHGFFVFYSILPFLTVFDGNGSAKMYQILIRNQVTNLCVLQINHHKAT